MDDNVRILPHTIRLDNRDDIKSWRRNEIEVRDDGIWQPCCAYSQEGTASEYRLLISKNDFITAYNKYIKCNEEQINSLPDKDSYFRGKMGRYNVEGNIMPKYSAPCFKCPNCGGNVRQNLTITLTSYPPQYRYDCDNCDYSTTGV